MTESSKYAVVAKNVSFDYGKQWEKSLVLSSVNVNVAKGEIYGLLGPSGCGKTTLLKLIIGLKEPINGDISVFGYKPNSIESGTPGIGVGYMPQEISLPNRMTIREIFIYFGNIYLLDTKSIRTKMKDLMKYLDLNDEEAMNCNLSGGEKRRVSLAIALFSSPRLLILDEPTVGVDPLLRQRIWSFLTQLTEQSKTTIIITTHYVEEMRSAKTVAFMRNGEILKETEPNKVIEQYNCRNLESVFVELCLEQKGGFRFSATKSNNLNYTNCGSKISVIEPLKEKRNKNRLTNEMQAIKATILKAIYFNFRTAAFALAYLLSLFSIVLIIFAIGGNPNEVSIGWVVDDVPVNRTLTGNNTEMRFLPDLLFENINKKTINIMKYETVDAALKDARSVKIMGYIHLKQNFSENFYRRDIVLFDDNEYVSNDTIDAGTVHLYLDTTNLILQQLILREMVDAFVKFREKAFMEIGIDGNVSAMPLKVAEAIHGTAASEEHTQHTHNDVVCTMVLICFTASMTYAAEAVVSDINSDVYGRAISAGLKPHQLILGEQISLILYMSSVAALNLIALIYVFNITVKGSLLLAIINMLLTILSGISLGALFGLLIHSGLFLHLLLCFVNLSVIVLSGMMWPLEAQPYFIKPFATFLPGILPIITMVKIFNYEYIDFPTYILPSFLSSTFYYIISTALFIYFLKKIAI